ncbi:MAG: hypothetical protein BECKG1743E_GA0114224_100171, partial [Candidatus Kentron sp. G]
LGSRGSLTVWNKEPRLPSGAPSEGFDKYQWVVRNVRKKQENDG